MTKLFEYFCGYCNKSFLRRFDKNIEHRKKFCSHKCNALSQGNLRKINDENQLSAIERFYKNTTIPENKYECWIWKVSKNHRYGIMKVDGKQSLAHRFIYKYTFGDFSSELLVCHHCDNTKCVNPYHLFLGTSQDNFDDMILKSRERNIRIGSLHSNSKLSENDILRIKSKISNGETLTAISIEYNVHLSTIWKIKDKVSWCHV